MIHLESELNQSIVKLPPESNKPSCGFKLPQGYLSHSQIEMYLRCPRQYYFRYIRDMIQPPGVALTLGKSTHKAIEMTHHHIVDNKTPAPIEVILDMFSDHFDEEAQAVPVKEWNEEGQSKGFIKDMGVQLVTLYNRDFAPSVHPQVINNVRGIEKKVEIMVADVPMIGYIDLIDTNTNNVVSAEEWALLQTGIHDIPELFNTAIVDFKTKSKSYSQGEIDNSFQLTFYSYAEEINFVRCDQLLKQKKPKITQVYSQRTSKDYAWMHEIIHSVATAISAGIFPPADPTAWACTPKWCGFWNVCRGKRV